MWREETRKTKWKYKKKRTKEKHAHVCVQKTVYSLSCYSGRYKWISCDKHDRLSGSQYQYQISNKDFEVFIFPYMLILYIIRTNKRKHEKFYHLLNKCPVVRINSKMPNSSQFNRSRKALEDKNENKRQTPWFTLKMDEDIVFTSLCDIQSYLELNIAQSTK
jgi:hypothetical protein